MPEWKPLPEFINGFRIIEDLGYIKTDTVKRPYRLCIAECKQCKKPWKIRPCDLRKVSSCFCNRLDDYNRVNERLEHICKGIFRRCYNKNDESYPRYGGRGIEVCDEWIKSRRKFYQWALANGYRDHLTIDRIDNNKGYSPDNCRWTNYHVQMQNSTKAKLTAKEILEIRKLHPELSYSKLAKKYNVHKSCIAYIVTRKSWRNI